MANRRFNQFAGALENGVVKLFANVAIGATGAPTLSSGKGIASITRTAVGNYRVTLDDRYNLLLGCGVVEKSSTASGLVFQVVAESVDSATPYIDIAAVSTIGDLAVTAVGNVEVQTVTFDTKANSTAGDFVVVYDTTGQAWGISLDVAGTDPEPTAAAWLAIPAANKVHVDISGATTAAEVAAAVEVVFDALTGVTSVLTTSDAAANGTMTFTSVARGSVADPVVSDDDGAGAGSIAAVVTTEAVAPDFADPANGNALLIELALRNTSV